MADKKRKYLLFKKDDGRPDHLKPCAFFASDAGCKNGSKCKFSHDPAIMAGGSEPSTPFHQPQAAPEPVSRMEETPQKDKKKRRTNEFMDEAPMPLQTQSFPFPTQLPVAAYHYQQAPQPSKESEELRLLREQLQLQQKQLELLQRANVAPVPVAPVPVAAPVSTNSLKKEKKQNKEPEPSTGSKLSHSNLFPTTSFSQPALFNLPVAAFEPVKPAAPVPAPKKEVKYESSSDDEEFLFKAVNHALNNGRQPSAPAPAVATPIAPPATKIAPPTQVAAPASTPAPASSNNGTAIAYSTVGLPSNPDASFPFMDPASALKALETSGTAHATHGSKKKNIFASPAGKLPVKLFDPSSVNFEKIDWNQLVAKTQSHKRFKSDYSFSSDQTWITGRSESAL